MCVWGGGEVVSKVLGWQQSKNISIEGHMPLNEIIYARESVGADSVVVI